MSEEKRFDVKRGFQGCLVTWACMFVLPLSISLVLNNWLGLISQETERVLILLVWLFAISLGGYVAARLGKTTAWTNSLVVGLLAEIFLVARLPTGTRPDRTFLEPLLELLENPGAHWPRLVALALTIPAAILGGIIWDKTSGAQSAGKAQAEVANKSRGAAE